MELLTANQASNPSLLISGSLFFHLQHCDLTYDLGSIMYCVAFNLAFNLSVLGSSEVQTISAADLTELY